MEGDHQDAVAAHQDADGDTATLVDEMEEHFHDGHLQDHGDEDAADGAALGVAVLRAPTSPPSALDVVKVSVTVKAKTQLLELPQGVPLQDVCLELCTQHGLRWRPDHYALTTVTADGGRSKAAKTGAGHLASHKYITEENRHELAHGAELTLAYAPSVFCDHIVARLSDRTKQEEWSRALQQLAELSGDAMFVAEFARRPGSVALVLGVLLASKQAQRLRAREKVWALRVVLCLVRQGVLTGRETALPELVVALCVLVRAEHGVDADVLVAALRVLTAVSAKSWALSPVPHLGVEDLVPLLWDPSKPDVQATALELMNALAARESLHGPESPEGLVQVTRVVTSPMVCSTIVTNILAGPVRSNMARQLSQLQALILQPLKKALDTPSSAAMHPLDPLVLPRPPPRLQRRKTSAAALLQSRSWCGDEDQDKKGEGGVPEGARDRRSLEEESPYKLLSGSPLAVPLSPETGLLAPPGSASPASTSPSASQSTSPRSSQITASTLSLDFRGSTASLISDASGPLQHSRRSSNASGQWTESSEAAPEPGPPLSRLGEECLEYLCSHHPALSGRAESEEEALRGSLAATAERLVRLLGAELSLCDDAGAWSGGMASSASTRSLAPRAKQHLYQPLVFAREVPFFHELFCRGLNLLAKTRREMRAKTQRDQDKVLRVVRRQFREALYAQVASWDLMDRWLSELPYSAVAALWEKETLSAEQDTVLSSPAVQQLRQRRLGDHGVRGAPGLRQLVRQQRLSILRAGAKFRRTGRPHRAASKRDRPPYAWVWLAQRDAALQHADCDQDAVGLDDVTAAPEAVHLAAVTTVVTGRKCGSVYGTRGRKQSAASDLALSLVLDPQESEAGSLDLIAPDADTLQSWADGLNMLLGKEFLSAAVKRDLDLLLDMEVRLQLMELDGVTPPAEPPAVPPPPPDYDFATD